MFQTGTFSNFLWKPNKLIQLFHINIKNEETIKVSKSFKKSFKQEAREEEKKLMNE
jgi:hypothetical protein